MRILVPVDGSAFSKAAVAFVASRATLHCGQNDVELLNVQHAIPPRAAHAAGKALVVGYQDSEANKVLKPAVAALKRVGVKARSRYLVGAASTEVAAVALADPPDLVVMGSHGHTGLKRLLFGSVTSAVLAACNTPVLIVRDTPAPEHDSLDVGIALDGSDYGLAALRFVIAHRDFFGLAPRLVLIHVVPDLTKLVVPDFWREAPPSGLKPAQIEAMQSAAFDSVMAPARKLLTKADMQATEIRLVGNDAAIELATYSIHHELDILALGSHGHGASKTLAMGSVAARLGAQRRLALLLVPAT